MRIENSHQGFTLIETIVAFAVLFGALVGPIALITHGLSKARTSQNVLVAANLAQEGLELVRAVRENNNLCDILNQQTAYQWNNNPAGAAPLGTGSNNLYTFNIASTSQINCKPPGGSDILVTTPEPTEDPDCATKPLKLDTNQRYAYSGTPTPFARCITICVPPNASPCNATNDSDIPASDQMEIITTMSWKEFDQPRSFILRERLYNWR